MTLTLVRVIGELGKCGKKGGREAVTTSGATMGSSGGDVSKYALKRIFTYSYTRSSAYVVRLLA